MSSKRPPRICLFGAAGDTANLGVSALMYAAASGLAQRCPDLQLTVFDNGWGIRAGSVLVHGRAFWFQRCGARLSRRYHRPESLWHMRMSGWLGGVGNAGVRLIRNADAVLDVSGGDSFSDIYGHKRFRAVLLPKQITLHQGVPLVLLPQTYGPFAGDAARREAASIVARASLAWARDADSFQALRELLGDAFRPDRHRLGVDMAFALEPQEPQGVASDGVKEWLAADDRVLTVGLNVSGLLYNDPLAASRYGLRTDYQAVVRELLHAVLARSDGRVLLIPHVGPSTRESDGEACADLFDQISPEDRDRVAVAPEHLGPREMKWVIAQLDWFCGTRMHSTIAALSSGVPAAAIAYSDKTRGVFATCRQERQVADARKLSTDDMLARLWDSWCGREQARADLLGALPGVLEVTQSQMDTIFEYCRRRSAACSGERGRGESVGG